MTRSHPRLPRPSDLPSRGHDPSVLDDPRAVEMLVRFDETSREDLQELRDDPAAARLLDQLEASERWLRYGVSEEGIASRIAAISSDELYRFGGGPGAEPIEDERRAEIELYLEEHPEESGWVEALSTPVPKPVEVVPLTPDEARIQRLRRIPGTGAGLAPQARRMPAWAALAPLAAAALVLFLAFGSSAGGSFSGALPAAPALRGAPGEALLFPRGQVLAPVEGTTTYATRPLLEVAPAEGAASYRFEIRSEASGAFAEGEVVWAGTSTSPSASAESLQPGDYAWTAWALVDGLERQLGTLTFSVVVPAKGDILRSAAGLGSDPRLASEDVQNLHDLGFLTDARHRARFLAPSEARTRYLDVSR